LNHFRLVIMMMYVYKLYFDLQSEEEDHKPEKDSSNSRYSIGTEY